MKNYLHILLITMATLALSGCASSPSKSYQKIGAELKKNYRLSGSEMIINYDLAHLDNTNCIYSADLGLILNNQNYADLYLNKFHKNYKSSTILRREAMKKTVRIYKLLLALHKKHRILTNNKYQYVKKIARADLTKIDMRKALNKLDNIISRVPVMLPIYKAQISSKYGQRYHPIKRKRKFHCGIDLAAKTSSPIYSAATGRVKFVGRKNGYGNVVEIEHSSKVKTRYAHLSKILVSKGERVIRGTKIGLQGKSGTATKQHLHFEIHLKGKHVNPYSFIGHACRCR